MPVSKHPTSKWWISAFILIGLVAAAPYVPVDLFRGSIERALERGLGRKVEIGAVHVTLFPSWTPAPGFTLGNVTIHEDPRAGIEPFAYVESLGASVRVLSLLRRKLEFSSLNLGGQEVNINMVKTSAGPWNFQYLLGGPAGRVGAMPALRMRGGRVNFKFGDTKSVFYFNDADLDVTPGSDGSVEVRFGGAPARTDHSAQDFGRFFVRGTSSAGNRALAFNVELERSSLEETLRLFDPTGFGVQGSVALEAQLSGAPSALNVTGQIQIGDVHRWDLLPTLAPALRMPFNGSLDLKTERLELSSAPEGSAAATQNIPVTVHLNARDLLSAPNWDASADLNEVPLAPLVEIARHAGVALPEKLTADGSLSGSLAYSRDGGLSGRIGLEQVSIKLPEAAPLAADSVSLTVDGPAIRLEPATLRVGETRSVEVEGGVDLGGGASGTRALDLKISTRGLSIANMRSFGLGTIPLLEHATAGVWRGSARYRTAGPGSGEWSGDSELLDANIPVEGLADPVRIQSAAISLAGKRASISRLRATVGEVGFAGAYRWEPSAARPHHFSLSVAAANAAELTRLLDPTLVRQRGFLARTLGLRAVALPDWLKDRHAEGTVAIETLSAGDARIRGVWARVIWDGGIVHALGLNARLETGASPSASLAGDLTADLTLAAPEFHFEGEVRDVPWRGGRVDLEGIIDAEGGGLQFLESARAEGRLRGRGVAFAPDAEFRTVAGEFQAGPGPARWKFSNLEVAVGPETFLGSGGSQSDGRIVLDLASRGRQIHYASTLLAAGAIP